jgi:hypothetical protein
LQVPEQASQPVSASLLAELRFWEARQVFQQAWPGQWGSRVPAELGNDSLAGSPEPAALPERDGPELRQRSVYLLGLAWPPQQLPDAHD